MGYGIALVYVLFSAPDLAIAQKREALERVLIPETVADHLRRVTGAGFKRLDIWLKWFNFCSWICQK